MSGLIARNTGSDRQFESCPAGPRALVLADVVDLGLVDSNWQGKVTKKHKARLVFLTDALMSDGRPFGVSARFTVSLHKKAALRTFLETWRGKKFTEAEVAAGFDLERLIGKPGYGQVSHVERNGEVYANLDACMALPKGVKAPTIPSDYLRRKDRDNAKQQAPITAGGPPEEWGDAPPPNADDYPSDWDETVDDGPGF